jgi:hypothetical protein
MSAGRWTCTGPLPSWRDLPIDDPEVEEYAGYAWVVYPRYAAGDPREPLDWLPDGDDTFLDSSSFDVTRDLNEREAMLRRRGEWNGFAAAVLAAMWRFWVEGHVEWEREERP